MKRLLCVALFGTACFAEDSGSSDDGGDGSTTTTSSSGGSESTGPTATATSSVDDSSSSGGAAGCGNGVVEDDEPCDDGDDDERDGCTSACELGPRAVTMFAIPPPEPPIGEMGPVSVSASCYDEGVGVAMLVDDLYGRRAGSDVNNAWTVSASGNCARLELQWTGEMADIVAADDQASLPEHGNFDPLVDGWELQCPAGEVPLGVSGVVFPGGQPPNIVSLRLECAQLSIDAMAMNGVGFMPTMPTAWTPTASEGPESTVLCPPGAVMVGFRGDFDPVATAMYRFGPECAVAVVEFGPG